MSSAGKPPLRVEIRTVDGTTVVAPIGEVDIASVPALDEALAARLEAGDTRLVVDLEALDYLDSTGLGCVTAHRRRAREAGGELVLVCTRDRLLRLLAITGLDQVFTVRRSVAEAVAGLKEGGTR